MMPSPSIRHLFFRYHYACLRHVYALLILLPILPCCQMLRRCFGVVDAILIRCLMLRCRCYAMNTFSTLRRAMIILFMLRYSDDSSSRECYARRQRRSVRAMRAAKVRDEERSAAQARRYGVSRRANARAMLNAVCCRSAACCRAL